MNAARNFLFRMTALRKAMETRLTESKFLEMCYNMAEQDPDLKRLLDEYTALLPNVTEE